MPDCKQARALLPLFVLGDATPEERRRVDAHLAGCAVCRAECAKIAQLLEELRRDLRNVPIPDPLPPGAWWQTRLPDTGADGAPKTLSPVWRDVTVALRTVDAPEQLSPERVATIFETVDALSQRRRSRRRWEIRVGTAAAAVAILALGAVLWRSEGRRAEIGGRMAERRPQTSGLRPPVLVPAASTLVRLVRSDHAVALSLPVSEPDGTWYRASRLQLQSGTAVFRLVSDAEITLVGPAELVLHDGMAVTLQDGRLLAVVPPAASGFTVHTSELTAWDIGTIFGVMKKNAVSDVFVFKGEVQVTDSGGDGVGVCTTGEGARAFPGRPVAKTAADWDEARALFSSVAGVRALENPAGALGVAGRIGDLWQARYLPDVGPRPAALSAAPVQRQKTRKHVAFSKTPWVRPAVSAVSAAVAGTRLSEQEGDDMKTTSAAAVLAAAVVMGAGTASAFSEPVLVDTSPQYDYGRWTTIFTNEVPLVWDWPSDAGSAELLIAGMNGTFKTNFTTVASNCLWRAFASDTPSAEDVYALTLTFYGDGGTVVGALTSRLAVIAGAFGGTRVDPGPSDKTWRKVKTNVVLPFDAEWAEATSGAKSGQLVIAKIDGAVQTNRVSEFSGYFGWKLLQSGWGYGTFDLTLSFTGAVTNVWDAELTRPVDGIMISVK